MRLQGTVSGGRGGDGRREDGRRDRGGGVGGGGGRGEQGRGDAGRGGRTGRVARQAPTSTSYHPSVAARLFTAEAKLATDEPAWR